jgi:anaerobic ribonucleoside-triphosphate reductase activating protein
MDKPYIDGLTISGGNPLELRNIVDVNIITSAVRARFGKTKTIWVYTGYTWDEVMRFTDPTNFPILSIDYKIVLNAIDVLVDGRYVDELNDVKYPYAGSTNQRVIDVQQSLKAGIPILYKER